MLFFHQPFLIFLLILGWQVGVHWRCKLKFLLDRLTTWQRVVLLCLLAICQPSWWSKKDPHWSHMEASSSMTRGCLWATMVVYGLTRHSHQWTIDWWCLLTQWCTPWCSGISLSWSLLPMRELVPLKTMKAGIFWLIQGGFHPASHQHPSLSLGKAQS